MYVCKKLCMQGNAVCVKFVLGFWGQTLEENNCFNSFRCAR